MIRFLFSIYRCNEDTVTIVDVTRKTNPIMVSRLPYNGSAYTHQGWLDASHNYFLFGDEYDETYSGKKTKTLVIDVSNLQKPKLVGSHVAPHTKAIDHNQYIIGQYTYQATYRAGLRILKINHYATADMTEVGYFDIFPQDDEPAFNGAWGVYPFFPSGSILISGIEQGLYVLKANVLKPTTTVSSGCNTAKCRKRLSDVFFGQQKYYVHLQNEATNQCITKCVAESSIQLRKGLGWQCGKCPR
jgi:hypothetical protein